MGKLVRTICIIIAGFTLASLCVYRLRLGHGSRNGYTRLPSPAVMETEGEVSEVDEDGGRLVLTTDGDRTVVVIFDQGTDITDAGETALPSAITPGAVATVRYTRQNGRNRARSIWLRRPPMRKR